jgi:ABC-type glycerol-3-phosphate transport system substrate-binding protein
MRRLLPLLTLLALLASCGGQLTPQPTQVAPQPGTTPGPSGEGATISFAVWDYERPVYEPLADKFMAENPGIQVVLVPLDDIANSPAATGPESATALLRRLVSAADTAPAIGVSVEAFGSPLLLDLRPLMEADPNFRREEFYPGALERWSAGEGTWALPRYFYLQVLNYNRDLFTLANLPEPEAGWSWDELLAAAEQISGGGGVGQTYGYLDQSGGFQPLLALLKAEGLDVMNTPATELRLDDPRIAASMERLRALFQEGALYQPYTAEPTETPEDPGETVAQGRVGIWGDVYIPGPNGEPTAPAGIDIGRVPYPADGADPWGGPNGEAYIISGGTAYPNESWKWIEWLSRQVIEQPGNPGGPAALNPPGRIPAREALAEQTGFWQSVDEETAAAYRWALANPAPYPERVPDYLAVGAISQAMSAVVSNPRTTIDQALADAQKWLDDTYAQQNLTPTPEPDLSPVLVATPEPQVAPEGATTITFAVPGYSPSEIRRIARAFREERPDIFVQVKNIDGSTGPITIPDVAGQADCFTWSQGGLTATDVAALLDLQPLIDADASFPLDDFPPAVLSAFQRDGGTFGLPYAFNLRTLTYNRTAFDAAGIEVPNGGWSQQDFLAAAQALTQGEGSQRQYGYVALNGAPNDLLFFIGQFGGRLTSGSGQDLRPTFTDPRTVEAIRWYLDLSTVHEVMPELRLYYRRDDPGAADPSYEIVQAGRAGMWFDSGYGMFSKEFGGAEPAVRSSEPGLPRPGGQERDFEVGVSPLPVGSSGLRGGDFFTRGMHISAGTENAQACWEWIKYMTGDISLVYADYPARISVAQGEAYAAQSSPERLEIYAAYEEVLQRPGEPGDDPYVLYGGQMDPYWFFKAVDEAAKEEADLAVGLEEAQRLTTAYLECVAEGETAAICAAKVDPEYQGFNVEDPNNIPRG